ncbi:MAG: chromate transporter [Rhodopseudomonas sp.]|nr:chromate transporter [Rhodopseudomonas sp.]
MSEPAASPPAAANPTLSELFRAFMIVSVSGFGGALPWARRMIVEQKRWMTTEEFNEVFALSQFLPGPNLVNFSVAFGSRFCGPLGALVALIGLLGPPLVIVVILGMLYARFGELEVLGRILSGITAAAAGLLIAVVGKMAMPLFTGRWTWATGIAVLAFVGVALLRWPLPYVFLVLAPIAVALAWFMPVKTGKAAKP